VCEARVEGQGHAWPQWWRTACPPGARAGRVCDCGASPHHADMPSAHASPTGHL